jgi:hypothetical protein
MLSSTPLRQRAAFCPLAGAWGIWLRRDKQVVPPLAFDFEFKLLSFDFNPLILLF